MMGNIALRVSRAGSVRALSVGAALLTAAGCEFPGSSSPITIVSKNSQQPQLSNPTIGAPIAQPPIGQPPVVTTTRPPVVTTTTARPPVPTTTTAAAPIPTTTTQAGPPPVGNWDITTNLPAGLNLLSDNRWTSLNAPGWGTYSGNPSAPVVITTDASAPDGDSSVLFQSWAGVGDGQNANYASAGFTSVNDLFITTIVKFSSNWRSEGVKWLIVEAGGSPVNELPTWLGLGPYQVPLPSGGLNPEFNFTANNNASSYNYAADEGNATILPGESNTIPRGQWVKLQMQLSSNPDRGRVWLDDRLIVDTNQDQFGRVFTWNWASQVFNGLQQGATWGGGNSGPPPAGAGISYARTAIWGVRR